jgi:flagellar biosynthesis anti-sigma factor FlgM
MKIEGISSAPTQLPAESVAVRVSNSGPAGTQRAAAQDWTSFHSDSTSVQSLASQALNSPTIRQGRVDALRESVNAGQYPVDANKIGTAISNSFGSE